MMLLKWFSEIPECNLALDLFLREIFEYLHGKLLSVMLYGSIVFDDFAPGYGDLDFIALLSGEISAEEAKALIHLRKPLRNGRYGLIAQMIEGSFLPVHMIRPGTKGRADWWGTSGERVWTQNEHEVLDLKVIKERGILLCGIDQKELMSDVRDRECLDAVKKYLLTLRSHWRPGTLHSIDWLLTTARLILLLREGRLSSKSEAADWGSANLEGVWRKELTKAKELRRQPQLYERDDTKKWLGSLGAAVYEAAADLEREIETSEDRISQMEK